MSLNAAIMQSNEFYLPNQLLQKRLGRPRKKQTNVTMATNGICAEPLNKNNSVELLYSNPTMFRKLLQYLKTMSAEEIHFDFKKTGLTIWAISHRKKNKFVATIHGDKLNRYYCAENIKLTFSCRCLEPVFLKIDKNYLSIVIFVIKGFENRNIDIRFDTKNKITEQHKIDVSVFPASTENQFVNVDSTFKISFELPVKAFKKMINNIKLFSDIVTMSKPNASEPFRFEYFTNDRKIKSENLFLHPENSKVQHYLLSNESFRVSVTLEDIKVVACSMLDCIVKLQLSENKPIVAAIKSKDDTIDIVIYTQIADNRNIQL